MKVDTMEPKVKVAAVGCGGWGRNLIRNLAELSVLSAVVDQDAERAAESGMQHGVPARTLDEVLADPGIDAVVIATPAATHAQIAVRSLEAGKHVFVEKPLALTLEAAEDVRRAAQRAGRIVMVGHLLRYHPAFLKLQDLVAEGALGRVLHVDSMRLNLGRIRREENSLWSFAPHDISMILALMGSEPSHVRAFGSSFLDNDITDVTTTNLAFDSGQSALVHVSWLHPVKEQRLTIVGDRGMAVFDDGQPWSSKLRLYQHEVRWVDGIPVPERAAAEDVALDAGEPLRLECEHFLQCVSSGETPRTDAEEGIRVLKVLQEAQRWMQDPFQPPARGGRIDPTATIDAGVTIGEGTKVWHYSHILTGSVIGRDCVIGQNVMIGPDVTVGDRCKIQNNVSLYTGVTLDDGVFCGPSAVFTNVRTPRAEWDRRGEFAPTPVGKGATIGANATVVCGNRIGAYATVGAGAVVTHDVPDHALVVGNPARQVGWMSHAGERLGDDLVCPRTGDRYELREGALSRVDGASMADPASRPSLTRKPDDPHGSENNDAPMLKERR